MKRTQITEIELDQIALALTVSPAHPGREELLRIALAGVYRLRSHLDADLTPQSDRDCHISFDSVIEICGAFSASDKEGGFWGVNSMQINQSGRDADLFIHLDRDGALACDLCMDETFLSCIASELGKAGYVGTPLRRASHGNQKDCCVCLVASSEFNQFAISRGFQIDSKKMVG